METSTGKVAVEDMESGVVSRAGTPRGSPRVLSSPITRVIPQIATIAILLSIRSWAQENIIPINRGFFCDDESIFLPVRKSRVPWVSVLKYVFGPVLAMVVICEVLFGIIRLVNPVDEEEEEEKEVVMLFGFKVPDMIVEVYRHLYAYLMAAFSAWIVTDYTKQVVGSLRPHFIDKCKPDWSQIKCYDEKTNQRLYVTEWHCTADKLGDVNLSFPSGHSTMTVVCLVFAVLYLQGRFKWQQRRTAPRHVQSDKKIWRVILEKVYWFIEASVPCFQVFMLLMAVYVPCTRVVDHFHHIRDVLGGSIIGLCGALFGAFFVTDLRRY